MTDYTILTGAKTVEGSIKNLVNYDELPVTAIMENAQSVIYQFLRVREMKVLTEDTFGDTTTQETLPTGFLEPISLFRVGDDYGEIDILDEQHFESRLAFQSGLTTLEEGTPEFVVFDATTIKFNCTCNKDYPYRMWGYHTPAALSGANPTNFLTVRYPHIITAAVKHFAYEHRQSSLATDQLKLAMSYIEKANIEHDYVKATLRYAHYWER